MNKEFETILGAHPNTVILDGNYEDRFIKAVNTIIEKFPEIAMHYEG